jgi:uncharacterized protein involved in high-affinity Fe2+ transport
MDYFRITPVYLQTINFEEKNGVMLAKALESELHGAADTFPLIDS